TAFCFPKRDVNFKASAVDRQSDHHTIVLTTTPFPHNQTTSAHTEAGGEVFFCEMYVFCCLYLCWLNVDLLYVYPKVVQVKMLWLLPQHLVHTTRQLLKLLVGCFFLVFVWFSASLVFV